MQSNAVTFESRYGKRADVHPAWLPLSAAVAAGVLAWKFDFYPNPAAEAMYIEAISVAASVGATLLGFMLAALAVLASINHTHLVKMMRQYGHYSDLLATLFAGCVMMLVCTAVAFALLFGADPQPKLLAALVGLHFGALVSIVDTGRKFWYTLTHLRD